MRDARRAIEGFIRRNRFDADRLDLATYRDRFRDEMVRGLEGRPSSLPMIPTYIETSREVVAGRKVIALDAGGTNLRVAVVSFDAHGAPVVEDMTRHRMPGSDTEVGRDEFFRAMAEIVLPVAGRADAIGFCFSYAAEMMPDKDGKLLYFTKEIKARDVVGQLIGANLARAIGAAGGRAPARTILLNDTVATLLAGRNALPGRRFDGFVGVVCGTGINAAYVESNARIRKLPGMDAAESMIVNTESGSFGRGAYGPVDDLYNAATATPGKYRHEKTISGGYLGALCLFAAQAASRAGCFADKVSRALASIPALSTRELNDFLLVPEGANPLAAACAGAPAEDAQALYLLCDALVERAAAMLAVNCSAIVLQSDRGRDPRFPVCITVDGTTFWQLRSFRCRVESRMRALLSRANTRAWEITGVEDAPLVGAAIAALTN